MQFTSAVVQAINKNMNENGSGFYDSDKFFNYTMVASACTNMCPDPATGSATEDPYKYMELHWKQWNSAYVPESAGIDLVTVLGPQMCHCSQSFSL